MADEQYRWLNRGTTERLLRGEPLETVDVSVREQAERLAEALDALFVEPAADTELPGEESALAAFRKARDGVAAGPRAEPATGVGAPGTPRGPGRRRTGTGVAPVVRFRVAGPAGSVRRGSWACPARLALAAALAVGTVGGVAVAAGTGALPAPFRHDGPRPAVSDSAVSTPDGRPGSPSAGTTRGGAATATPPGATDGGSGGPDGGPAPKATGKGAEHGLTAGGWSLGRRGTASACRDVRDGRELGGDRARALDDAAGGAGHVRTYCERVLDALRGGDYGHEGQGDDVDNDGAADGSGGDNGLRDVEDDVQGLGPGAGQGGQDIRSDHREHGGDGDGRAHRRHRTGATPTVLFSLTPGSPQPTEPPATPSPSPSDAPL